MGSKRKRRLERRRRQSRIRKTEQIRLAALRPSAVQPADDGPVQALPRHYSDQVLSRGNARLASASESAEWTKRICLALIPLGKGLAVIVLGTALGWVSGSMAIRPLSGPVSAGQRAAHQGLHGGPVTERGIAIVHTSAGSSHRSGDQAVISWLVTNTGESTWSVDTYRFTPEDEGVPVLSLPATLSPKQSGTVRATLTVPPVLGIWQPSWVLTGPRGPVPGVQLYFSTVVSPPAE